MAVYNTVAERERAMLEKIASSGASESAKQEAQAKLATLPTASSTQAKTTTTTPAPAYERPSLQNLGKMDAPPTINPNTGKPYSGKQQEVIQSQYNQLTGVTTPAQAAEDKKQKTIELLIKGGKVSQEYIDLFTAKANPVTLQIEGATDEDWAKIPGVNKRDMESERATEGEYGADADGFDKAMLTYGPETLSNLVLTGQIDPTNYTANQLAELGFTPERLQELMAYSDVAPGLIQKLQEMGTDVGIAEANLGATPKPTNEMMEVLTQALNAKNNFREQPLGVSDLFTQAGLSGYEVLAQSLAQRGNEMKFKHESAANLVGRIGGSMKDTYEGLLANYESKMGDYNKQMDRLLKIDEDLREDEHALDMMYREDQLRREAFEWEQRIKNKYDKEKLTWQPETDNQAAGWYDGNGNFTPVSGGESLGDYNSYLGAASYGDGNSFYYETPVPHPTANTTVVATNPNITNMYENGTQKAAGSNQLGGQCAYEVQQWCNLPKVGNSMNEKAASFQKFADQGFAFYKGQGSPQVGYSVFSNDSKTYGHYSMINSITADGKLVLSEFNRAGTRTYSNNRIISPDDASIIGFVKTTVNPEYQTSTFKETAKAMTKSRGMPGVSMMGLLAGFSDELPSGAMMPEGTEQKEGQQFTQDRENIRSGLVAKGSEGYKQIEKQLLGDKKKNKPMAAEAYQTFLEDSKYAEENKGGDISQQIEKAATQVKSYLDSGYDVNEIYEAILSDRDNPYPEPTAKKVMEKAGYKQGWWGWEKINK